MHNILKSCLNSIDYFSIGFLTIIKNMKQFKNTAIHIGIYGRRNVGKSSLINALTHQDIAIVSEVAGTTTDPVKKIIEIFGIGPTVLIDTAGIDDFNKLGELRISKTLDTLNEIDLAILIFAENNFDKYELDLISKFEKLKIPFLIISNKIDLVQTDHTLLQQLKNKFNKDVIDFSALTDKNTDIVINELIKIHQTRQSEKKSLLKGLINKGDLVLLITPIDSEAPEGRMILPQVQMIRDILDNDCIALVMKEDEVKTFLEKCAILPKLAITDSQVFKLADELIPKDVFLTSFSILLAHYKGDYDAYLDGTGQISKLNEGDRVLLLESCTHQVSCDDIGRIKIPKWLNSFTGKNIICDVVSGLDKLSRPIDEYALVIQCGACVVTKKQLINRTNNAKESRIPITNYGMAIAYMQGVFERATAPFKNFNKNI